MYKFNNLNLNIFNNLKFNVFLKVNIILLIFILLIHLVLLRIHLHLQLFQLFLALVFCKHKHNELRQFKSHLLQMAYHFFCLCFYIVLSIIISNRTFLTNFSRIIKNNSKWDIPDLRNFLLFLAFHDLCKYNDLQVLIFRKHFWVSI